MGSCIAKINSADSVQKERSEVKQLESADEKTVNFQTYDFRKAKVIDVYDGDTFTIIALHHGKLTKFRVRLMEINAPEIKGGTAESKEAGKLAKDYLSKLILGKIVDIIVVENRKFEKKNDEIQFVDENPEVKRAHEPFGRLLSYVYLRGKSVSELMLESGNAVPYVKK